MQQIGLERFIPAFQAEEVDLDALSLFEEKDLQDLGLPKGPRVKLLRAVQGIFPSAKGSLQAPPRLEEMEQQLVHVEKQVAHVQEQLVRQLEELAARQQAAEEQLLRLEAACTSPEEQGPEEPEEEGSMLQDTLQSESLDVRDQLQELSLSMRIMQELMPSRVCWTIRGLPEKMSKLGPGKAIKAPPFALFGTILGMKLEFYPCGRGRAPDPTDDRSLPDIVTPRVHPALREVRGGTKATLPEDANCCFGICCPLGIKLQYRLQVGNSLDFDNCHVQWQTLYHDMQFRWRDELRDGTLSIVLTVARIHNKNLRVEDDTIYVHTE